MLSVRLTSDATSYRWTRLQGLANSQQPEVRAVIGRRPHPDPRQSSSVGDTIPVLISLSLDSAITIDRQTTVFAVFDVSFAVIAPRHCDL